MLFTAASRVLNLNRLPEIMLSRWPATYATIYILNPPLGTWVVKVAWLLFGLTVTIPTFPGRADTAYNYVQVMLGLLLALPLAIIWERFSRRGASESRALRATRTLSRYWLASTLIMYGALKLAPLQFPRLELDRLMQPIGQASPMGLMWSFMGASPAYAAFSGVLEVVAGLLLFHRRTTTLGALLGFAVMTQVLVLNLCYDLPVKLFSLHLTLLCLWLATPDLARIARATLGLANEPRPNQSYDSYTWWPARLLKLAVIAVILGTTVSGVWQLSRLRLDHQSPIFLRGSWRLESGSKAPRGVSWQRLAVPQSSIVAAQDPWGVTTRYSAKFAAVAQPSGSVRLTDWTRPDWSSKLRYSLEGDRLRLWGDWDGDAVDIRLQRETLPTFLLPSRGFHWISDRPFNQ